MLPFNPTSGNTLNILGVSINFLDYQEMLNLIRSALETNHQLSICYANTNTLNFCYKNPQFKEILAGFNLVHPDGRGIYLASRFLHNEKSRDEIITGSDFYPILWNEIANKSLSVFLFGDSEITLKLISQKHKNIKISGSVSGFNYSSEYVVDKINKTKPDILLVGLGTPRQEEWIYHNLRLINCKIILAVGDGLKVLSGTKIRGPYVMRKLGFEWFFRLINEPKRLWRRYILGNPLFLFRIIMQKIKG